MKRLTRILFVSLCALALTACSASAQNVKTYGFKVEEALPHDVASYTQGLFFYDGQLYESAGQYGESSFRKVDPATGRVLKRLNFEGRYFAEGSCVLNEKLYVLTWQEKECFVYDMKTWNKLGTLRYLGEGWGLTTDGKSLIMSDGTSTITFRNPDNFAVERSITVTLRGQNVLYLNELEYIKGEIWANVYGTDQIVRIDPATGVVRAVVNLRGILPAQLRKPRTDVLNGIAFDPRTGSVYVTGKYWPKLYRITLVEKKS
ncbi:MAG: glutaminyl-peptide cyclotransferase [Bacteroidales bacterium]|nr:glutaminyl-peptide cyclotransferase [Bacteroidales bacterium]